MKVRDGLSVVLLLIIAIQSAAEAKSQTSEKMIAVLDFVNNADLAPHEGDFITHLIRGVAARLPQDKYLVMTKENILELLPPDKDYAQCADGVCEIEFGRNVGADYVVSGEVLKFGGAYKVTMNLHQTRTASLITSGRASADTVRGLEEPVERAAGRVLSHLPGGAPLLKGVADTRGPGKIGGGTVKHGVKFDRGDDIVNEIVDDTGFLTINTDPDGATLFLNGKEIGTSPKVLDKMVGRYVIVAELGKMYHPARQELDLATEGVEIKLTLPPAFGRLKVTSKPSGAQVWLGGEQEGTTPYTRQRKPSGTYELRVVMDHYLSFKDSVTVEDGKTVTEDVVLQQNYGGLEVRSEPSGAAITLDGKSTGQITPHTYPTLEPGIHTVKLTLEGYGDALERATVRNRATERLSVALQAKYGLLSIMSSYDDGKPCRGKVFIDGRESGTTPMKKEVTAVTHHVRVACEKGEKDERVLVAHNEKKKLNWVISVSGGAITGGKAGIKWVKIPGRTFMMGSDNSDAYKDEKPVHRVRVSGFQMAKTEVTVAQYRACVKARACTKPKSGKYCNWGKSGRDDHPINCVDWNQAVAFSKWAGGRLPTEAEWEYAARSGGKDRKYPWGDAKATCRYAVMDDKRTTGSAGSETDGCGGNRTWPVCSKTRGNTTQGLCDMAGNVWEWVHDWYGTYKSGATTDPTGPGAGSHRVKRGGSWYNFARYVRAAYRPGFVPGFRGDLLGFRPVRSR